MGVLRGPFELNLCPNHVDDVSQTFTYQSVSYEPFSHSISELPSAVKAVSTLD
jgi:hypothetical protein